MARHVKTRRYDSPRRREQAAATRRQILDAARHLFEQHGYAGTTIAAIASDAGVAVKTVYVAFETKNGVLRALWNLLLRDGNEDVPVAQQAWYREVLDEQDPNKKLALNARNSRTAKVRIAGVLRIIRQAALTDPDAAALWERIQTEFHANQRAVVEGLAKKRALRRGLDVDRATDILWTLNHPDVWHILVAERGWTPDQYEEWFRESAISQLLK